VKAPKCGGNWCYKVVEKKEPDKDYPYDSKCIKAGMEVE
jgi:hypothetical protein